MKVCIKTIKVNKEELVVHQHYYTNNGNVALTLETVKGEPYGIATTNLSELPEEECYIKAGQDDDGILEELLKHGIITLTGKKEKSGFCTYHIARVNLDLFEDRQA